MTYLRPLSWYVTVQVQLGLLWTKLLPFPSHYPEYTNKFIFREVKFCLMLMRLKYKEKKSVRALGFFFFFFFFPF